MMSFIHQKGRYALCKIKPAYLAAVQKISGVKTFVRLSVYRKGARPYILPLVSLMFFVYSPLVGWAQQTEVKGTVFSSADNAVLPGATISIAGTSIVTTSDNNGNFILMSPHAQGTLVAAYLGHQTQEVDFHESSGRPISIHLRIDDNTLDHVQVIGYGETTKRFNTGSVVSISSKEIEQQPVTNVLSALSGRMPGVFVQTTNGLPGGNINIQIRGTGSIQAGTNPLYIIDGVPYDGEVMGQGSILSANSIVGPISPLNILNPNDIESITVLKDADATAIYGSRGSNGVVLISTKKGQAGGTKINVSLNQGFNKVASRPKLLNLEQYLELRREAFANDERIPSADPTSPDYAPDLTVWNQTEGTDWYDYAYGNTAGLTNIQLSVSGGNEKTSFNVSGNFRKEGTIIRGDNVYNKGGLQSNLNHLSENGRFKINFSSILNMDKSDLSNPANNSNQMYLLAPNYPLLNEDGSFNWFAPTNVEAELLSKGISHSNNFVGNLLSAYRFPMGLELKVSGGYTRRNSDQNQVFPIKSLNPGKTNYSMLGENSSTSYIIEPQAEYQRELSFSKLQVLIGGTYQLRTSESLFIEASNFANESLMRNLGSAGAIDALTNNFSEYKYVSAFGRLTYNIQDKYILNGTIRRDGSSRFGPDSRFGNFYSIGGAWLFSEEEWFKQDDPLLSFGKLRASYGLTGNDQISDYQYLSTYQTRASYLYQDISVLSPSRIFNSRFHWEVTKKIELAAELGFIKDRILFTTNYYKNRSGNQLVNYPLPRTTGFPNYQANLPAVIQNTGWEFDMDARIIENQNFQWTATVNLTLPKNKLVFFENIENSSYANTHRIGYDITRVGGQYLAEVNPETGIAHFTDQNGEIAAAPYNFHTLGKKTPYFYGGLGNNLTYKNLQFDVFFQFAKQSHFGNLESYQFGVQPLNGYQYLLERWQNVGEETKVPKVSSKGRNDTFYFFRSSGNFFDIPYFRLKNISLSYTLPSVISRKLGLEAMQLSASGHNLISFWDHRIPVVDPEVGGNDLSMSTIPIAKTIVFGFNLTL